jgi:hypothetical protein
MEDEWKEYYSEDMIPSFLIIGAEKSGTTWLYDRLRRHPDVFMPKVKEIHYFNEQNSNHQPRRNYEKHGFEWYEDHFRERKRESAVGEATPMYLCDEQAPERIRTHLPNVRLVVSLRYPTARAYSHYWMARGKDHTMSPFEEIVERRSPRFIERGLYGKQLERYLSHFERSQIRVLVHEELFADPTRNLNALCAFLEVEDTFYRDQDWIMEAVNPSSTVRSFLLQQIIGTAAKWMRDREGFRQVLDALKKTGLTDQVKQANKAARDYPPMPVDLRRELDEYYASTVLKTEEILGRRIPNWRERSTAMISE